MNNGLMNSMRGNYNSTMQQQKEFQPQTINSQDSLDDVENNSMSQNIQYNQQMQVEDNYNHTNQQLQEVSQSNNNLKSDYSDDQPLNNYQLNNFISQPTAQRQITAPITITDQSNRQGIGELLYKQQQSLNISGVSSNSLNKQRKNNLKHKTNSFYYDRIGDQLSIIIMEQKNITKYLTFEIILPMLCTFIIIILLLIIQNQIGEYCFIVNIECSSYWIRLWSFFRQQILFKLGIVFSKGHILYSLVLGNKLNLLNNKRKPVMEYFILILLTIATDFIMIFWVGFNEDWLFIIYVYILGFVVFFNTFRMKTWPSNIIKGFSFFLYDITIIALLMACFLLFPYIKDSFKDLNSIAWQEYYFFVYPFIDLAMEIFMDMCLNITKYSELYIYQGQLLIIGTRVGTLVQGNMKEFQFWFCLFFLILFRINNISLVFTVFIRRIIYYQSPDIIKPIVSMEESNLTIKGKHGACIEHLSWIVYFYMFCISQRSLTSFVFDEIYINNGTFESSKWSLYNNWEYKIIIIWAFLLIPEIIGYLLNKTKNYDNIKMLGGNKLRMYENIFIRIMGIYLFNFALMSNLK